MKRFRRYIAMMLTLSFLMAIPALATVKASDQIFNYRIDVIPTSNGEIAIEFSITGTGMMNQIGGESIQIYERTSRGWTLAESYDKDDPGMSDTDNFMYGNTVYFYGDSGTDYMIYVSVFAEDPDGGYDSRDDTFYVTAR